MAILAAAGSARPTVIVGTAFFATLCAATVAVVSAKFFERLTIFRPRASGEAKKRRERTVQAGAAVERDASTTAQSSDKFAFDDESLGQPPLSRPAPWGMIALALLGVFFAMLFLRMVMPDLFRLPMPTDAALQNPFARMVNALSILAIPFLLSFFLIYAAARRLNVFFEFVVGAKDV